MRRRPIACALAKKSWASLDISERVAGAEEPDPAALVEGVEQPSFAVEEERDGACLLVGDEVNGKLVLVEGAAAVRQTRLTVRAGGHVVSEVEVEVEEEGWACSLATGCSMLTGVAEREPVGVGLAWIA